MIQNPLYSKEEFFLQSVDTILRGNRVFNGTQIDDFALVNLKNNNKILLLGGGQGGTIRTLLINNPNVEIYVVDIDENNNTMASTILKNVHFFKLNAENIYDYFEGYKFDSICIDLYTNTGYPEFLFKINYLSKIKSLLTNSGIVILNAFGLPDHLHPFQGNNPQVYIMNELYQVFNNVSYISNRRNMTLVSFLEEVPLYLGKPKIKLNSHDLLAYNMLNLRWKSRMSIDKSIDVGNLNLSILSKDFLNKEMLLRWKSLLNVLNQYLLDENEPLTSLNLKDRILNKPEEFLNLTFDLLQDNIVEASFLPISVGSLSYSFKCDFSWFIEWFISNKNFIMKSYPDWGIHFALTQIVSIMINPYGNYDYYFNAIEKLIQERILL